MNTLTKYFLSSVTDEEMDKISQQSLVGRISPVNDGCVVKNKVSLKDSVKKKISEIVRKLYDNDPKLRKPRSVFFKEIQNSPEFKNLMYSSETQIHFHLNEKILLLCGGAFGHLTHPYEDLSLTFKDVKDIVNSALSGKLQADEKVDGQNLMFTWKGGHLRAARNKGHIKNYGVNALTKDQLDHMFSDRPPRIRQAFVTAMGDLETALKQVDVRILEEIFQEGKRFINVEVILPATQNVVPYGLNVLVFHGTVEYDEVGNPIGQGIIEAGQYLENIIKKVNANVQKNFTLRGPNRIVLKQVKDFQQKKREYLDKIKKAQGKLLDSATIADYHSEIWGQMIIEKAKGLGYTISKNVVADLVNRWVHDDKSKRIAQLQKEISSEPFKQWIREFDGNGSQSYFKQVNEPFENLFLKLGVDVLINASGYLAASPDSAAREVAQQTQQEIEKIKRSDDPNDLKKLEHELDRIQKMGGLEKTAGTEGITFYKNGKIYKLTGLFASINQILGMIRYKK